MSEETMESIFGGADQENQAAQIEAEQENTTTEQETGGVDDGVKEPGEQETAEAPTTEGKMYTQNGVTYKRIKQGDNLVDVRV